MNVGRRMAQIPKDDLFLSPSKDEDGQALEFVRPAYIRTSFFTAHDPSPLQKISEVCVRSSAASRRVEKGVARDASASRYPCFAALWEQQDWDASHPAPVGLGSGRPRLSNLCALRGSLARPFTNADLHPRGRAVRTASDE